MYHGTAFSGDISMLGFGLMRLPRVGDLASDIDFMRSSELIDHAMANGVNYFDTAFTYAGSEEFAGRALSKYPRDSYYLASKCPPWKIKTEGDFERIFDEQCRRCKTDYFDFYLVHNLAQEETRAAGNESHFAQFKKHGIYDMYKKKKSDGRIRRLGFSFHGTLEIMQNLVDEFEWDFAQIQLNYVDWAATNAKGQYELLTERGVPVVVMEPLRGGALAQLNSEAAEILKNEDTEASLASWGMRYAASLRNVVTVLSGMNSMGQLADNIATMNDFHPVDDNEIELLSRAAAAYSSSGFIACTGCGYCLPCPQGVSIPRVFSVYNHYKRVKYRIPFDNGYSTLGESENASGCTGCGKCEKKCPQHLAIPEFMREIDDFAGVHTTVTSTSYICTL